MQFVQPVNLNSAQFLQNEYAYYTWLREHAPVSKAKMWPINKLYVLSRYDDIVNVLKDKRFVRNRSTATGHPRRTPIPLPKSFSAMAQSMIIEDEPNHRRLRNLVHKAFTPRTVASLEGRIDALSHELLDRAERQGTVDLLTAYAQPIPVTVIAEMLGVPEADRKDFQRWSGVFTRSLGMSTMLRMMLDVRSIVTYMRKLIARRRADPQDDLLSGLIQAEDEGHQLSEDELVSMAVLLLFAGYETTINLIANGTRSLLLHPEQLALLRDQPDLIGSAVEEILRYDSPVASTKPNYANEDVEIAGVTLPKGTLVLPLLASANRDERVFERPDCFDITRSPNKHLGFGNGIHYCLGAPLARLEGKIAIQNLVTRFPNLRFAVDPAEIRFAQRAFIHRLLSMPVSLT